GMDFVHLGRAGRCRGSGRQGVHMAPPPNLDRAPGAIPRACCWERIGSIAPNSWYLNLVPRDSAACAHSGRHYGERTRAVPVARTRAQVPVNLSGTQARTLPALAFGDLTTVLPLRQGHPRIRTHGNSQKETRLCKKRKRVRARKVPKRAFALASPSFERQPKQRARRGFEWIEIARRPPNCTRRIQ